VPHAGRIYRPDGMEATLALRQLPRPAEAAGSKADPSVAARDLKRGQALGAPRRTEELEVMSVLKAQQARLLLTPALKKALQCGGGACWEATVPPGVALAASF
jgi:hypothetical protein